MNQLKPPENGYQSRVRTNVIRLFRWNGAWGAATALMALGPGFLWNKALVFTLLAVGLDIAVGVGMILATKKFIAELDELHRKVLLDALAIFRRHGRKVAHRDALLALDHRRSS